MPLPAAPPQVFSRVGIEIRGEGEWEEFLGNRWEEEEEEDRLVDRPLGGRCKVALAPPPPTP